MHLQQHPHIVQPGIRQRRQHPHHRALDDVGAGALDRGVDRGALTPLPFGLVLRIDPREPRLAAEQGLGIALGPHRFERFEDVALDAREALEIGVDHRLRLVRRHFQPRGETPAADAVEDREVDRLGARAGIARHLAEHLFGRAGVDVLAIGEGFLERIDPGHMRRQPQFDLRIVGGEQHVAEFGHEGLADLAADRGAHRYILEVGVG